MYQVLDSSIFAFWSKSSVDVEAKRIRLKSNSYTSNTILDTVTAATVQVWHLCYQHNLNHPIVFTLYCRTICGLPEMIDVC
jgi:hypothetical protein